MAINNNIITKPIGAKEPYTLLDVSKRANGYDVGYICSNQHGKINMWSRYKPVHIANATAVDRNTLWYKGTNNDCGITPKMLVTYTLLPDTYDNGEANWSYSPPWGDRGGTVKSPYRLADFDKYKHDAIPVISKFTCPVRVKRDGTFTCGVMMPAIIEDENEYKKAGSLTLGEIYSSGKKLSEWYYGAVVTNTAGQVMFFAAGNKTTSGTFGHGFPEFKTNSLALNQTYYIYPCLALNPQEQGTSTVANTYLTLPNCSRGEFKVVTASELDGISISITARYVYSDTLNTKKSGIVGEFTVTCDGSGRTFTNNYIQYRFSTSNDSDAMQSGEGNVKLLNFTVQGSGGTYSEMFSFNINSAY